MINFLLSFESPHHELLHLAFRSRNLAKVAPLSNEINKPLSVPTYKIFSFAESSTITLTACVNPFEIEVQVAPKSSETKA